MHMFGLVSPTPRGKNLFPGSVQPKPCVDVAAGLDVSVGFAVGFAIGCRQSKKGPNWLEEKF